MFGVTEILDFKPPFVLNPIYHKDSDILMINFAKLPRMVIFQETELKDIEVGLGNTGKIVSILFRNASNNLANPLTEEEKVILRMEVEEARKRARKRLDLIRESHKCKCGGNYNL